MSKVIVLGAGMVGSAMAIDMAKNHEVTLTDIDQGALDRAKQKCSDLNLLLLDLMRRRNSRRPSGILNWSSMPGQVVGISDPRVYHRSRDERYRYRLHLRERPGTECPGQGKM